MYGETAGTALIGTYSLGLSPHVRGNRHQPYQSLLAAGSIPACTGKPSENLLLACRLRVYPRMYGETR